MTCTRTALLALCCLAAGAALADGCFLPDTTSNARAASAAQKAVLIREGGDEVLLLQTTYHGPAARFAWVVPVPSPPREVFAAEPAFLEETFAHTEPVVATEFTSPPPTPLQRLFGRRGAEAGSMAPPPPPGVSVLSETEAGDYHAAVLAATRVDALQAWLQAHRYRLPPTAAGPLAEYVRRGWFFVALKMHERATREQPLLREVQPLGLRFRCPPQGLVYPLTISRLSAPPLSSLLLCIIAEKTYACTTLPTVWLPGPVTLSREETYGDVRRRYTRSPTRLLCEFSGEAPFGFTDLGYRATDWETGRGRGCQRAIATRLFGLVEPGEMTDLYFRPALEAPTGSYCLLLRRQAPALSEQVLRLYYRLRPLLPASEAQQAARARPPRQLSRFRYPGAGAAVLGALAVIACGVSVWRRRRRRDAAALVLLVCGLWAGSACCGTVSPFGGDLPMLTGLRQAMDCFAEDTGAWPKSIADLAARAAPPTGLDASGNECALTGWRGPYLADLPPELIRGGSLVCDPLNLSVLDSTGFTGTCTGVPRADAWSAAGKPGEASRTYWDPTPRQVARRLAPYQHWLQHRRGHHLFAFAGRDGRSAFVVDRTAGEYFALQDLECLVGYDGQILSHHNASESLQRASWRPFVGLSDLQSAFRLLPAASSEVLALGPGGLRLLAEGEGLVLEGEGPGSRRPLNGERPSRLAAALITPDARNALILDEPGDERAALKLTRIRLRDGRIEGTVTAPTSLDVALGPGGALHYRDATLSYVTDADGSRTLVSPVARPAALALGTQYAYYAMDDASAPIFRVRLSDSAVTSLPAAPATPTTLAADGDDLYVEWIDSRGLPSVTLLAGGTESVVLRSGLWLQR